MVSPASSATTTGDSKLPTTPPDILDRPNFLSRSQSQQILPGSKCSQSQHSQLAKDLLLMHKQPLQHGGTNQNKLVATNNSHMKNISQNDSHSTNSNPLSNTAKLSPMFGLLAVKFLNGGVGNAASDTPEPSLPASPRIPILRNNSAGSTPRMRPTTLDIPGLTRSKVSPDGRISKRDSGSKLIIIMVGLPARGKSYITKKLARYLNWLQHDTKIFNVGERRRIAASAGSHESDLPLLSGPQAAARALMTANDMPIPTLKLPESSTPDHENDHDQDMGQSASFFDPDNQKAAQLRELVALETLDELFHYIFEENGAVGIFDATNSTLARRKLLMEHIRARDSNINVLFLESFCQNETLLDANMRLKLSGPDYKDKDPVASLEDFKKRVAMYEKHYIALGQYEEDHGMSYVKMIDVGKKLICNDIKGFLSTQAVSYLMNFNLAPRQIWITRHGESLDNVSGKIGGDSSLSNNGRQYSKVLAKFCAHMAGQWEVHEQDKIQNISQPPAAGDHTPPNPYITSEDQVRNFCVWTSMLRRGIETAERFNDDDFEIKEMRMLDELNPGSFSGLTYEQIRQKFPDEFALRQMDKLSYRYPGQGESYLDVINRLRQVIDELERMTDHCLLICHRSVARVLLAYFKGLNRDDVANLDCPLGLLYCLEPKPYGVEFKAYRYNPVTQWFDQLLDYQLKRENNHQ